MPTSQPAADPRYDVVGEVVAVGEGVTTVATGDRVYIHCDFSRGRCEYGLEGDEAACTQYGVLEVSHDGGYAEWVVTPIRNTFALAESLSFETAAAAGAVYLTAYRMLFSRGALRPGETVLVTAAGSGVGGAAIALARFAGASVLATAGTEAKPASSRGRRRARDRLHAAGLGLRSARSDRRPRDRSDHRPRRGVGIPERGEGPRE
jgi:NADPH:quinone reductase-like Zn-dependent oxidoreductase